jgi:hypothetical protein
MKKDLEKSSLDYEEGRLQPTPAGHPQLATLRANPFLLVVYFIWGNPADGDPFWT